MMDNAKVAFPLGTGLSLFASPTTSPLFLY